MKRSTLHDLTGIEKHANQWRAIVSQGRNRPLIRQTFPIDTPIPVMQQWREDQKALIRVQQMAKPRSAAGAFDADVLRYLRNPDVRRLPTFPQRSFQLGWWVREFGQQKRDTITAAQIRAVRDRMTTEPRSERDSRPLTAGTINKYLRSLSNLWRVLDGKDAPNPVRQVDEFEEAEPRNRAVSPVLIRKIIDLMPDRGKPEEGKTRSTVSLAKLRLRVLAETGLPPGTLQRLSRASVDFKRKRMTLPPRKKGKGVQAVSVPLTAAAVEAFRALDRADGWGHFSHSSVWKSFQAAVKRVDPTLRIRVYDLRHSFGTELAKRSKDEVAVAHVMQHASIDTTRKYYTSGSLSSRADAAVKLLDKGKRKRS